MPGYCPAYLNCPPLQPTDADANHLIVFVENWRPRMPWYQVPFNTQDLDIQTGAIPLAKPEFRTLRVE